MESILYLTYRDGMGRMGTWVIGNKTLEIPHVGIITTSQLPIEISTDLEIQDVFYLSSERSFNIGDSNPSNQSNRSNRFKKKLDSSKLRIYNLGNPLLSTEGSGKDSEIGKLQEPYLVVPESINYPESFTELGISPEGIYKQTNENFKDLTKFVQLITNPSQKLETDTKVIVLANALKLIDNPRVLVNRILSLDHRTDSSKLLYLPGIAYMNNLAVLTYLGADIFDTCQCVLHARSGNLMTTNGVVQKSMLDKVGQFCSCSGCQRLMNNDSKLDNEDIFSNILIHNVNAMNSELNIIKSVIIGGRLRELVEQRMVTEPRLSALVRIMDLEFYSNVEQYFPIFRFGEYLSCSHESLNRVEIKRFRDRVKNRFEKPKNAKILLFLPCSAKKPYSTSKSHKLFKSAIQDALPTNSFSRLLHDVIITSPLGLVPRELELVYPAQQYDIPVIGHWFENELEMIRNCISAYLMKNEYDHILIHFDSPMFDFIENCINELIKKSNNKLKTKPTVLRTSSEHPTSKKSLQKLTTELNKLFEQYSWPLEKPKESRWLENIKSIAYYQFGKPCSDWINGCKIKGKYPNLKIFKDNVQMGMLVGTRGFISLTMEGAKLLAQIPEFNYKIDIEDFVPKGSIMAVGVRKADESIRIGDEVIACHDDEVRAVGTAVMCGAEMECSTRGIAVKVRHHV